MFEFKLYACRATSSSCLLICLKTEYVVRKMDELAFLYFLLYGKSLIIRQTKNDFEHSFLSVVAG